MRFKDVFSIIGPAMVGPSSSHTAGAARLGRSARHLFGRDTLPDQAEIILYGSFAATYQGHGTDQAIVGGILDYATDDERLPQSLELAEEKGMMVDFIQGTGLHPHPNTAKIILTQHAENGEARTLTLTGISIGGGNVEIVEVNGFHVRFTGTYPTLVITHSDIPGVIADITQILKREWVNIGYMSVDRKSREGDAMMVLELDTMISDKLIDELSNFSSIRELRAVELT